MRVIKEIETNYEPFHETLPIFTKETILGGVKPLGPRFREIKRYGQSNHDNLEKLFELQNKINCSNNLEEIEKIFNDYVQKTLKLGVPYLFFTNEKFTEIKSFSGEVSLKTRPFLNELLTSGIIKQLIENKTSKIFSDNLINNKTIDKTYYLLMPFFYQPQNNGCLVVTVNPSVTTNSPDIKSLKIVLEIISEKIDFMDKQRELINVYNELQLFQTRLANDYKLSAVGELTTGILEDILSPLQVITSYIDFIKKENQPDYESTLNTINLQTKKINRVVNTLINFAKPVEGKLKLLPCDINEIIIKFYNLIISNLKKDNYECILDLDKNIPSILSHQNYLNQVLMNTYLLLKPDSNKVGGVLLQSKYQNGSVLIKFFTTDYYKNLEKNELKNTKDANIKIIQNLVRQHEGKLKIDSEKINGTIITITFPIRRKI